MEFAFTAEQRLLQDAARSLFAAKGTSVDLRRLMESEAGYASSVWREFGDLGWIGILAPERFGGLALGMVELAIIQEQAGFTLYPSPLLPTVGLALPAILASANEAQCAAILPSIVAGERTVSLAYTGHAGIRGQVDAILKDGRKGLRLSGEANFVPYGHAVDTLVITAQSSDGLSLVVLPRETPGLSAERVTYMDPTRAMARLRFDEIAIPKEVVLGALGKANDTLERALDLATIALAAEQVGAAEKCLTLALDHAKHRVAFGRPIGGFQAIKHLLADMVVQIESARSAAYYAACIADEATGASTLAEAASVAAVHCAEAFYRVAADTIQIHGGMGFTWEHDAHLYFKRARCSQSMFGDAAFHCERVAQRMEGA
jgi:alkylation response protein AidB-like acyl-CoA dehydrogenase